MSDLISRQVAIRAVNTALFPKINTAKDAEKALRDLPSAQPDLSEYSDKLWRKAYERGKRDALVEPQWIQCSERLPKEKQDVLLAFKHNMVVGFWEDILNDGGQTWYANSGNGWMTPTETVDDDGYPLAWMPLPDLYKGEQSE